MIINKTDTSLSNDFMQNLLSGNRKKCSAISKKYLENNHSIEDLYENVFKKALYEVGKLWETNKITVASEHLATAITEGILNELYENLEIADKQNKKVIVASVDNELHQVGIKMVADVFEMHGWESYFLGSGIPITELVKYIKEVNPDILAISLTIFFNYQNLLKMINTLKKEFPDLIIILGGQAFTHIEGKNFNKLEGINYFSNLYELDNYLKTIKNSKL